MARPNSLQTKIEGRIAASGDYVFLTREFSDLSGRRQVLRALRKIVAEGRLVRLGCRVYGLAVSPAGTGKPLLHHPDGFLGAVHTALTKLGVDWEPPRRAHGHREGQSQEIADLPAVRIRRRFSRRLSYGNTALVVER